LVDMDSLTSYLNSWISYRSIFLWSVYARKPQNLGTLEDAIITEMQSLPVELCHRACQSVPERLELCKEVEKEHLKQDL